MSPFLCVWWPQPCFVLQSSPDRATLRVSDVLFRVPVGSGFSELLLCYPHIHFILDRGPKQ